MTSQELLNDNSNFRSAIWLTYFEKLLISDWASFSLVNLFQVYS